MGFDAKEVNAFFRNVSFINPSYDDILDKSPHCVFVCSHSAEV